MNLFDKHREALDRAVKAVHERTFYARFPEHPRAYGEAVYEGAKGFDLKLDQPFKELLQGEAVRWAGEENSPFTRKDLNIDYPIYSAESLLEKTTKAFTSWRKTKLEQRAGILMEALVRIEERFGEIAQGTMHTTGQSFMMSFQASGPHAADRGLEAMAMAWHSLHQFPKEVDWIKPVGRIELKLEKEFLPIPKGPALVIGCSTFPTWNSAPGIFANLMVGNSVIVKPHPKAVYPIAVFVAEIQKVLETEGLDSQVIQLAVDSSDDLITKKLAESSTIKVIDYTGGNQFGDYLEGLPGKTTFTEKSAINPVIIDSAFDLREVMRNLAFSLCLYSGQMCTAPQNFFIPETGVKTKNGEVVPYAQVVDLLQNEISAFVLNPKMGVTTLGAIQSEETFQRARLAPLETGNPILPALGVRNKDFPKARLSTPCLLETVAAQPADYEREFFGPVALIVKTKNTADSIARAKAMVQKHGAITCAAYTVDDQIQETIKEEMNSVFAPVTFNLMGFLWVNQHATFSDFHGTGGNASGNASFSDPSFVNRRFVWIGNRQRSKN